MIVRRILAYTISAHAFTYRDKYSPKFCVHKLFFLLSGVAQFIHNFTLSYTQVFLVLYFLFLWHINLHGLFNVRAILVEKNNSDTIKSISLDSS